jgi:DNA-binding NtrC family response regulator
MIANMPSAPRIAIVDDEASITNSFADYFSDEFDVLQITDPKAAISALDDHIQVAVVDERMPGMSGIELLCHLRKHRPKITRILLTAHEEYLASAINTARIFHYVEKPPDLGALRRVLHEAVREYQVREKGEQELHRAERERDQLVAQKRELLKHDLGFSTIIHKSTAMENLIQRARKTVDKLSNVLIHGETGTGKGALARAIHYEGVTRAVFHSVNIATLTGDTFRSEMFGSVRGAFTGAQDRAGYFETADKGTLFLDEIGELPQDHQVMLLTVLEDKRFARVGSTKTLNSDVRIIAATNKDLTKAVRNRSFREDLYHRLAQFEVTIPPLRERPEDIPALIELFLARHRRGMSPDTVAALCHYEFPGNVRELESAITTASDQCEDNLIQLHDLPDRVRAPYRSEDRGGNRQSLEDRMTDFAAGEIRKALSQMQTQKEAAELLGITPEWLRRLKKRYRIP